MIYRVEDKYIPSPEKMAELEHRVRLVLPLDPHIGGKGFYTISSLYFDDINNKALHEKLGGIRDREKYRIRIYNVQDTTIHFEKKIKYRDYIAKVKVPLTRELTDELIAGRYDGLYQPDKPLLMELYQQMKYQLLRPKVIVDYVREPYVCHNGNVRITFDKELRTGLHSTDLFNKDLQPVRAMENGLMILEVKYDEYIPEYIRAALQLEGLVRQSASKYVICRKFLKTNSWEDY